MANRVDWYFKQKVTEAELDEAFNYLEQADRALAVDMGFTGIFGGLSVAAQVSPNLTVQVALGVAYSKAGERIEVPSAQTVDVSKDYNNVTTTVSTPLNTRWLSLFLMPDRTLSDPRTDGNNLNVFFERAESFKFKVVQSSETPSPTKPALDVAGILLCDIARAQGVSVISNGDIFTERRENSIVATGSPRAVSAAGARAAIQAIVTFYNNHVLGSADRHPATAVDYAGSGNFANGTPLAAGTLEVVLDALVSRLASTTATSSGIRSLGAEAQTVGGYSTTSGTLFSQLTTLLTHINSLATTIASNDALYMKLAGTQTVTGQKTYQAPIILDGQTGSDLLPTVETTQLATVSKLLWRIALTSTIKFRVYTSSSGMILSYALAYSSGSTWNGEGSANGWILELNATTIKWYRYDNAGAAINRTQPVSTFTWELPVSGTIGAPNNLFLRAQGFLEGPGIVSTYGAVQGHSTVAGSTDFSLCANYPKKFTVAPSSVTLSVTGSNNIAGGYPVVGSNDVSGVRVDFRLTAVGAYALAVRATTT